MAVGKVTAFGQLAFITLMTSSCGANAVMAHRFVLSAHVQIDPLSERTIDAL
jgi:hypothetical protein